MTEGLLLVRVHDRPGALERVLGAVRRKALAVRRLSLHAPADGRLEVVLRFDPERSPLERMTAELESLFDVHDVRPVPDAPRPPTREMALAHLRASDDGTDETGRVVERGAAGVVVEVTGTPSEVDDILARFRDRGVLTSAVRTGEVVVPLPEVAGRSEAGPRPGADQTIPGPEHGTPQRAGDEGA